MDKRIQTTLVQVYYEVELSVPLSSILSVSLSSSRGMHAKLRPKLKPRNIFQLCRYEKILLRMQQKRRICVALWVWCGLWTAEQICCRQILCGALVSRQVIQPKYQTQF
jgi:hypothetical protein